MSTEASIDATPHERMAATLRRAGIPSKSIEVYGSQIMVTCASTATAQRWHSLLSRLSSRVRSARGLDGRIPVWRVGASL